MKRTVTATAIFSVVLAGGMSSALAATSGGPNAHPDAANLTTAVNEGYATGDAILSYAESRFADRFGGVTLEDKGNDVVVHLTSLDGSEESAIASAPGVAQSVPVRFELIARTVSQQQALHNKVTQDVVSGYWTGRGVNIASWGPDSETGYEDLSVVNATDSAVAALTAQYGPGLTISSVSPSSAVTRTYARDNDSAPFNGSDFITDGTTGDCSSGIPVHSATTTYLITAAHCFTKGSDIFNGSITLGLGGYAPMGSITDRDTTGGGLDAELDNVSSSDLLYTGPSGNPSRSVISGRADVMDGQQVCVDGAFSGEVCGATIMHHGVCVTLETGRQVCSISQAERSDQVAVAGPGDSGGPVFEFSGTNLEVAGTVTGAYGVAVHCDAHATGSRSGLACTNGVAFTDLGPELADFSSSLSVNTG